MKRLISVLFVAMAMAVGSAAYGKSYGSGSGSPSGGSKPTPTKVSPPAPKATPAPTADAPKKADNAGSKPDSSSTSSGKKYGSGDGNASGGSKKTPPPASSPPPPPPSNTSGQKTAPAANPSLGAKPSSGSNFAGSQQQKEQHSAQTYAQKNPPPAPTPKATYTDAKGQSRPIARDPETDYLRGRLDGERYANRNNRLRNYYGPRYDYYYSRPVIVYNDHYSSAFQWWLLDQSLQTQAYWMYNHRYSMDAARYNYLLSQNASLAMQVSMLESQRAARDPHWSPSGWDYDAMLDDNYVAAVYNPAPVPTYSDPGPSGHFFRNFFLCVLGCVIIGGLVWLVFFRDPERN
jgi:hypothetical protein